MKLEQWVIDFIESGHEQSCNVKRNKTYRMTEHAMIKGILLDSKLGYVYVDSFGGTWEYAEPIKETYDDKNYEQPPTREFPKEALYYHEEDGKIVPDEDQHSSYINDMLGIR